MAVQGIPGKPTVTRDQDDDVDIENLQVPHSDADAAEHEGADTEVRDAQDVDMERIDAKAGVAVMDRQIRMTKKDRTKYGYTPGCNICVDLEAGFHYQERAPERMSVANVSPRP